MSSRPVEKPVLRRRLRAKAFVEPYLVTDVKIKRFKDLLKRGLPPTKAACLVGFPGEQLARWKRQGKEFFDNQGQPEEHAVYGELYMAWMQAEAAYHLNLVERLHDDTRPDWRRWMSILERRDRRAWLIERDMPEALEDDSDQEVVFI